MRYDLTEVWTPTPPESARVDLVLVHGLHGSPETTWTSDTGVFWPSELLPLYPSFEKSKIRVIAYGYDADVFSFQGASKDRIIHHAEALIHRLCSYREQHRCTERPIIFLAHSLGGLVVKRALIASQASNDPKVKRLRQIYTSTFGILFLGTPHKGASIQVWDSYLKLLCYSLVPKRTLDSQPQLVDALQTNSDTLLTIDRDFMSQITRYSIGFYHEGKPTDFAGTTHWIVEEDSAAPSLPDIARRSVIEADHSHVRCPSFEWQN